MDILKTYLLEIAALSVFAEHCHQILETFFLQSFSQEQYYDCYNENLNNILLSLQAKKLQHTLPMVFLICWQHMAVCPLFTTQWTFENLPTFENLLSAILQLCMEFYWTALISSEGKRVNKLKHQIFRQPCRHNAHSVRTFINEIMSIYIYKNPYQHIVTSNWAARNRELCEWEEGTMHRRNVFPFLLIFKNNKWRKCLSTHVLSRNFTYKIYFNTAKLCSQRAWFEYWVTLFTYELRNPQYKLYLICDISSILLCVLLKNIICEIEADILNCLGISPRCNILLSCIYIHQLSSHSSLLLNIECNILFFIKLNDNCNVDARLSKYNACVFIPT